MSLNVVPHLNFRGEARAALDFYKTVFGGDLIAIAYKDTGFVPPTAKPEHLMWGQVTAESGFSIMAFDAPTSLPLERGQNSFYVSARFDNVEEAKACWEKLKEEAAVRQEIGPAAWSPMYGMLQDRFGIVWVVDVFTAPQS